MKNNWISLPAVFAVLMITGACTHTYYIPKDIPAYSELKEKINTSAVCMQYPHPMTVPECDRLLYEELLKNGYSNTVFNRVPVSLRELEAEHIIQPLYLSYTYLQGKEELIITYQLVVMVRPPGGLDGSGQLVYGTPRYFQAFSRKTVKSVEQYPFFSAENMLPVIQNLFRNPAFRKALEPIPVPIPASVTVRHQ